ncbi:hypothetical protein [Zhongshania sp.]|uniref:hypothetical protein n=1 Tax=Zhongshania sp. TaxID=1971902 RepID=UPI003564F9C6
MHPNKVIYFPYSNQDNPYNSLNQEIIKSLGYAIADIYQLRIGDLIRPHIVITNWLESHCVASNGRVKWINTFKIFALLLFIACTRSKLIYVRHNYQPHGAKKLSLYLSKIIIRLQESLSYKKLTHLPNSKLPGYSYIPHPLYSEVLPLTEQGTLNGKFIIIGAIERYKKVDEIIEHWPTTIPLTIAGKCDSPTYLSTLKEVSKRKGITLNIIDRRLSNNEIKQLLMSHSTVVIAHDEHTAIVSGTYYLAKSSGCLTLSRRPHGPKDCVGDYIFHNLNNLQPTIESILCATSAGINRHDVFNDARIHYGKEAVSKYWLACLC